MPARDHTLIVLRHAKSDWSGGEADIDRPLAARGRRQAPEAGRWLSTAVERVDLAVVSPARRTRSTWELVAAELDSPAQVRIDERVYAASAGELLEVVQGLSDTVATAVLVGHNPGVEELVSLLTGQWVPLPTSALALVDLVGPWAAAGPSSGALTASGRPPPLTR